MHTETTFALLYKHMQIWSYPGIAAKGAYMMPHVLVHIYKHLHVYMYMQMFKAI